MQIEFPNFQKDLYSIHIRAKIFRFYSVFLDSYFFSFLDKLSLLKNRFVFILQ
ncbi:hypothetical protein LEP1GSC034_0279 [Leptospira interrogans str. 2003000735]|uniref:Uncharacterized protein n=13 Tax=Leptospira TaxID=171 RepID=A0A0E2D0X3_LEPIR|nr:hypothetical protein G436_1399 [Leptospira interrogans serovar Hardjo str. Norma]EJP05492.1 hypothetical protein LEP1GSC007_1202 [Leptospira interrogans serovar Bulgarica str. Mallika]EJP16832.1 hypothetical protein LEP1GSC080_2508 [Leptospira interrogans str. FPW2026]EKN86224.1 hypothetical protein LEP1GSC027_2621 [Leptospira interrogans str. 2002000624]EKO05665.1 hypothetical protein LEP1GSC077_3390 [Leptospira interrogans str. C10069]EKO13617.1 hypothetical protein LEP1GSC081_0060 [Lepto